MGCKKIYSLQSIHLQEVQLKKGEQIYITIEKFVFEGYGLGRLTPDLQEVPADKQNLKIFVRFAYPGDVVLAQLTKIKKNYAEALLLKVITPSKDRIEAPCSYFTYCGGCKQQNLEYTAQANYKQTQIEELFVQLKADNEFEILPIVPSTVTFEYRNKMEFSFADFRWLPYERMLSNPEEKKLPALGFHPPQGFNSVMQIEKCYLQTDTANQILNLTSDFFFTRGTSVYNNKADAGYLRNLVIRQAANTPDLMVNLVTNYRDAELMKEYTNFLLEKVPAITTILNNINSRKAMIATGEVEYIEFGKGFIVDSIGHPKFQISANSFFQTNTRQGFHLYQLAKEFAELTCNEIVYDLYCGAGTISLFIADSAKDVYGLELVESAVNDANANKSLNETTNVHFYSSDLYKSFLPLIEKNNIPNPDVVIIDPPRNGMHKNTVEDILTLAPPKIVYVSCNPATQVRDIQLLLAKYKLVKIRAVDMFPHTAHIENVALLVRS